VIADIFAFRGSDLNFISCLIASDFVRNGHFATSSIGSLLLVYFEAFPCLCIITRLLILFVYPA